MQVFQHKERPSPTFNDAATTIRRVVNGALYSQFGHPVAIWPTASHSETSSWNPTSHLKSDLQMVSLFEKSFPSD